jgi:hypothetical protein
VVGSCKGTRRGGRGSGGRVATGMGCDDNACLQVDRQGG